MKAKILLSYRSFIGNNQLEEALNLMLEYLLHRAKQLHDDFLLIKSQHSHYMREYRLGLLSDRAPYNKLVQTLIVLGNEVEATPINDDLSDIEGFTGDTTPLLSCLYANVYGLTAVSWPLVSLTLHPDNPGFAENEAMHQEIFHQVPLLDYHISSIEITAYEPNFALLKVCQQTLGRHIYPQFRDNELIITHTLKPHGRLWKIYGSMADELKFLVPG